MIVEWLMTLSANIAEWLLSLFPPAPDGIADVVSQLDDRVNSVMVQAAGLGPWLDWVYALVVVGIVTSIWVVGIVVRLIRWVISFIPTMSGGT